MANSVDTHRSHGLARLLEQVGEAIGERESPHWRQVGQRGAGQVETIGPGLRCGAFVWQDTSGAFVDDLEGADHSAGAPTSALRIDEFHAIDGERVRVVGDENT